MEPPGVRFLLSDQVGFVIRILGRPGMGIGLLGSISPRKKLGLLPVTDSYSPCVTSWVPIQKPPVRVTCWRMSVTRV